MFDTCDNNHMCHDLSLFIEYLPFPKNENTIVRGASKHFKTTAEGIGTIRIITENDNNEFCQWDLPNVVYLPSLDHILFSPGQAIEQGFQSAWSLDMKQCKMFSFPCKRWSCKMDFGVGN